MTKILCNSSLINDSVCIYIKENGEDEGKHYGNIKKELFNSKFLKDLIKKENIKKELIIDIQIKTIKDLMNTIKIINECTNYTFIIDIYESEIPQRELLKIMNQNIINKDNVMIKYQESSNEISYNQYNSMYKEIYKIIEEVEKLDLSPLERVMYVFDIVKSNIYKENEEKKENSRDLYDVINGNYIVCVGYSNMMDFILKELNININILSFYYENKLNGHARNSIYLKDDKYGIDNVFFLDATFSSRKNGDDKYLDEYRSFLFPYCAFRFANPNEHFRDSHYRILELHPSSVSKIIKDKTYVTNMEDRDLIVHSLLHMYSRKQDMHIPIAENFCEQNTDGLLNLYNGMFEIYGRELNHETFFKCLFNVRKKQYEAGRIDHIPSLDEFNNIMVRNYGEYYFYSQEQLMMSIIFSGNLIPNKVRLKQLYKELNSKKKILK